MSMSLSPQALTRRALSALPFTAGGLALLLSASVLAQSPSGGLTLPAFNPHRTGPVAVLGGVEPPQISMNAPASRVMTVATQAPLLEPPILEPRETATASIVVPTPKPEPQRETPSPAKPEGRPRLEDNRPSVDRPNPERLAPDRPSPDRQNQDDRAARPQPMRGPQDRGPDRAPQDRASQDRGPDRAPQERGNNVPRSLTPPGPMMGMMPMNMPNGPRGESIEKQLELVDRIFQSPMLKRYFELMEENARLRAEVQFNERVLQLEKGNRERGGDREPPRRPNPEQAQAEMMMERRLHEINEHHQAEKKEMMQQLEKLKERLRDMQAAAEQVSKKPADAEVKERAQAMKEKAEGLKKAQEKERAKAKDKEKFKDKDKEHEKAKDKQDNDDDENEDKDSDEAGIP